MRVSLVLRLICKTRCPSAGTSLNCRSFYSHHTWTGFTNIGNANFLLKDLTLSQFNHFRNFSSKQESYFSAIGGESDEPPPELTPEEVTSILSGNEMKLTNCIPQIKVIECNQLASNQPTEDRLRISKLHLKAADPSFTGSSPNLSCETMLFAVFDGHGGRLCADVITRRLFSYIALSMVPDPVKVVNQGNLDLIVHDLHVFPNIDESIDLTFGKHAGSMIKKVVAEKDAKLLLKYAHHLQKKPASTIEEKLTDAFIQCDLDLSDEIETGLLNKSSNVLLHYYLSLAVSGCCVTLIMVHGDDCYAASTGDCKAVLGFREIGESQTPVTKSIDLTNEHNSDNVAETKRLLAAHPPSERNSIIRNDRLLSHLMPFRAFGDFCYKWEIDKIKRVGLTRAYGSHIIPPYYYTPPYLIAEPEVSKISLLHKSQDTVGSRYIVIATDGLWEQFDSSRRVVKQLFKREMKLNSINPESENVPKNWNFEHGAQLGEIKRTLDDQAPTQPTSFEDFSKWTTGGKGHYVDANSSTHLLRAALGHNPMSNESHLDDLEQERQQHKRLVTFLTLPQHAVRNFRDDISIIVLQLN